MATLEHEACSRVRSWISLQLDGQLSELELRLLEVHVGRCERCREFERHAGSLTALLREQPPVRLEVSIAVPSRRLPGARRVGVISAVAATVAVAAGVVLSGSGSRDVLRPSVVSTTRAELRGIDEVRTLRRQELVGPSATRPPHVQRSWLEDA